MLPFTRECKVCGGHFFLEDLALAHSCLYGRKACCKKCKNNKQKKHYHKNKETINKKLKRKYSEDTEYRNKIKTANKITREKRKLNGKQNEYLREKRKNNPELKMIHNLRTRLGRIYKQKSFYKNSKTKELLGCSPEQLREHLRSLYQPGMSDKNYGEWHIDHIIPLSSAQSKKELDKLSHYTNLQPLWAEENIRKKDSIPYQ